MYACKNRYENEAERMIARGADVNHRSQNGNTALMITASYSGTPEIAERLLSAGANVNAQDNDGYTSLMTAAHQGNVAMVRSLLEHGANLRLKNRHGGTAADCAQTTLDDHKSPPEMRRGARQALELLHKAGAKPAGN
jgi:ankyrin repeat protein